MGAAKPEELIDRSFTPFTKCFRGFDGVEQYHIRVLLDMYQDLEKRRIANPEGKTKYVEALYWVLTLLTKLEDAEDDEEDDYA